MKRKIIIGTVCGALAAGVAVVAAAAAGSRLFLNGTPVSEVRVIDGAAYVKLTDLAKALDMVVVKSDRGYELAKAGGANQVDGKVRGKLGETLFDGKWRFQAVALERAASYKMKHRATTDLALYNGVAELDGDTRTFTPKEGRDLVIVRCRLSNGRKAAQSLWVAAADTRTALADVNGQSHPAIAYDMEESAPFNSKALLPGAALELSAIFCVPQGPNSRTSFSLSGPSTSPGAMCGWRWPGDEIRSTAGTCRGWKAVRLGRGDRSRAYGAVEGASLLIRQPARSSLP